MTTDLSKARRWLLYGAAAALAAGALSAGASGLELAYGEGSGLFTVANALVLASAAPLAVVLIALLALADATRGGAVVDDKGERRPDALRKSSLCVFGLSGVLLAVTSASLLNPEPTPWVAFWVALPAAVALAALAGYAFGGGGFTVFVLTYMLVRYGGGWTFAGKVLDYPTTILVATGLLLVASAVCYPVWFAAVLFRRSGRLGPWAAVLAGVVLMNVVACLGLAAWMMVSLATAPPDVAMDEKAVDALAAPHLRRLTLASLIGEAILALTAAAFFLDVRRRLRPSEVPNV